LVKLFILLVPGAGIEPARCCQRGILRISTPLNDNINKAY
jgi:hypothetical protein